MLFYVPFRYRLSSFDLHLLITRLVSWNLSCNFNHCWAGTALYPSGAHEFTPVFSGVRVTWSLVLCVCFVDRCLSFWSFSFGHCVVFWPLCCLSLELRILITPLVSSNSSCESDLLSSILQIIKYLGWWNVGYIVDHYSFICLYIIRW